MAADSISAAMSWDPSARATVEARFRNLIDANGAALARLAASYTSSTSDRDDLLQEIALALWRALPKFRGDCSERTFLFRIAHNRCIAHLSQRGSTIALDDASIDLADPRPGADVRLSHEQQAERLLEGIRRLPLIYRQAITLSLEGLAYKEIGQVLGIAESNVGVRLNRARQLLRSMMEGT
jgi:RNA polymerase sigma factor (sigma-70 family)